MIGDKPETLTGIYKEAYEELLCTYEPDQINDEMMEAMINLIQEEQ